MAETKYRPYFTESEITYLISCVKSSSSPNLSLIRYLETFKIKIDAGVITASLLLKPSVEESLGFDSESEHRKITAETTARNLYDVWLLNPTARSAMSAKQLMMIQEHRYLNDLMTPAEETEYESQIGKPAEVPVQLKEST